MRRIDNPDDFRRDIVRYELDNGQVVTLSGQAVRKYGAARVLADAGMAPDPATLPRKPVYRGDEVIGSLPADFDPQFARSTSLLYDIRQGDFVPHRDGWQAIRTLGPGDLEVVPGFRRE